MKSIVVAALDRVRRWIGVRSRIDTWRAVWALNKAWAYEQTNDWVFDLDPQPERVAEVIALLGSDADQEFSDLLELAEQGSARAMLWAGWCYWSGEGVVADATEAEKWYRRSAQAGSLRALLDYAGQLSARRDYAEAEKAFALYAPADWAPAQFYRAWYRLRLSEARATLVEVRPLLESAAEHGSPMAGLMLWRNMLRGRLGLREIPLGVRLMLAWVAEVFPKVEDVRPAKA